MTFKGPFQSEIFYDSIQKQMQAWVKAIDFASCVEYNVIYLCVFLAA